MAESPHSQQLLVGDGVLGKGGVGYRSLQFGGPVGPVIGNGPGLMLTNNLNIPALLGPTKRSSRKRKVPNEQTAAHRRAKHKEVEVRRRRRIGDLFGRLAQLLDCNEADKATVLQAALSELKRRRPTVFDHDPEDVLKDANDASASNGSKKKKSKIGMAPPLVDYVVKQHEGGPSHALIDLDNYCYTPGPGFLRDVFGVDPKQIGGSLSSLIHQDDLPDLLRFLRNMQERSATGFDVQVRLTNGFNSVVSLSEGGPQEAQVRIVGTRIVIDGSVRFVSTLWLPPNVS